MADLILLAGYLAALPLIAIEFKSIVEIIGGLGATFMGSVETLAVGLPDMIDGFVTLIQFSLSQLVCAIKLIGNFHKCFIYYLLDIIGQIFYLPVRIIFWVALACGYSLYKYETIAWEWVEKLDCFLFPKIGFHIAHYPNNVHEDCYNCCRVKTSVLMDKGNKVHEDIMRTAPHLLIPGINLIQQGAYDFMHPFG